MRIDLTILVAVLAALAPVGVAAQDGPVVSAVSTAAQTTTLTLEEAVALALRDNRELRSVRLWRVLDRFDLFLARRSYYPSGGVSVAGIRRKVDGQVESENWTVSPQMRWRSPVGTSTNLTWSRRDDLDGLGGQSDAFSASVRQPLLRGGGLDVNMAPLTQARIADRLSRLREEEAVAGLIDRVTYAYRNLIQTQEQVVLMQEALARARTLLETNQALIEAGRMAAADIVQTQSEVANQEVALLETQRTLNSARTQLLALLALDPSTPIRAVQDVEVAPASIDPDHAVQIAQQHSRELKAQRLGLQQQELSVRLALNNRLWDVSVVAGYDRFSVGHGLPDVKARSVGLQVEIPIADFTGRRGVMGARTALHTAQLSYDDALERVDGQVREAVADVQSRWRQLEAAQRARALAQRSLDLQQERLQAGRASNFEVLSLQTTLRSADAQALSARIAYLNALTALDQKLGRTLETWRISLDD